MSDIVQRAFDSLPDLKPEANDPAAARAVWKLASVERIAAGNERIARLRFLANVIVIVSIALIGSLLSLAGGASFLLVLAMVATVEVAMAVAFTTT